MNKYRLQTGVFLVVASLLIAFVTYGVSFWLLHLYPPSEISAVEGILFILGGLGFLLGSGGISRNTAKAALLASAATKRGGETIGPSEIFRRDAWKPKGHIRLGLTLITAGTILIMLSFVLV
jgi:hypothetical protein